MKRVMAWSVAVCVLTMVALFSVIRPAAGPLGMTVKALDNETMEAYLRVATR